MSTKEVPKLKSSHFKIYDSIQNNKEIHDLLQHAYRMPVLH